MLNLYFKFAFKLGFDDLNLNDLIGQSMAKSSFFKQLGRLYLHDILVSNLLFLKDIFPQVALNDFLGLNFDGFLLLADFKLHCNLIHIEFIYFLLLEQSRSAEL